VQQIELHLRQLRFHSFVYMIDPTRERRSLVDEDHRNFENALDRARQLASSPREHAILDTIEDGYRRYRTELDAPPKPRPVNPSREELLKWADAHPVRHLMAPCEELLRINREAMDATAQESQALGEQSQSILLLLGILGPVGGLISGFGVAWGLSRSMTRLSVRLQDVNAHLDQELGSVQVSGVGDLAQLDLQTEQLVCKVREVIARSQQQQQEMLRAEQLAAVGQLAASMAHEVRNPLTSIKLLVSAARRSRSPQALSAEDLEVIHSQVSRLEGRVQELLDSARPPEAVREECDLRGLVNHALDLVRARIQQLNVSLEVDLPDQPVLVRVDCDQFTSVLVNLFLNALDAMPQGGGLKVVLGEDATGIRLTVADTGPGIATAISDRLFTPFTSTKPTGTGLGLSISRRIVRDHGGTLTGENRSEGGALFTIVLPEVSHANLAGR
jgi:signal transduction histidine kinase